MHKKNDELQSNYWPPISAFKELSPEIEAFLYLPGQEKFEYLQNLSKYGHEKVGEFIQHTFSIIFSYHYGYKDSPCYYKTDLELELKLVEGKFILTQYYMNNWLGITKNSCHSIDDSFNYLKTFIYNNAGVNHELFDYLEITAPKMALIEFLMLETCRNELVDDEVSLLFPGLQGKMKSTIASNLWDECGNGKLNHFHTFWLRRLLNNLGLWDEIVSYREHQRPWFTNITSNTFNMLVTRPAFRLSAYGCFLTTEARVQPHFKKVLNALKRVGLIHEDVNIYFSAHTGIDVRHTKEMFDALEHQEPNLTLEELNNIITGSQIASVAGVESYNRLLGYLKNRYTE